MTIRDVFALTGGRTVLTGELKDAPSFIGPCDCELAVEGRGPGNSRNGSYPKTVTTDVGPVELRISWDRNATFD